MKKYIYVIALFIVCPSIIKAAGCTNSDKVKYQELAKNISYSYDYVEENGNISFNVTFSNIAEDLYLFDFEEAQSYPRTGSEMTINNLKQGTSYKFGVFANSDLSDCGGNLFYTLYVNIPYYNHYYKDELCYGIEDYKFCNKWLNTNITYETFKDNVLKYKKSLEKEEENNNPEEVKGIFGIISDIYLKYYYIILPTIILLCVIGIRLYNKKHDLF